MGSVLQDWVMELPLREQGVMISAVRGCDISPKPIEPGTGGVERHLAAYLRYLILNAADPREIDVPGAFMRSDPPIDFRASELGHLPVHYYSHLMHAFQVVSDRHPEFPVRLRCLDIYATMVNGLHLEPEGSATMRNRLSEDRFTAGTVVS
jgi:hypothetical protein